MKAKIDKADADDAARPASEKAKEKADALADQIADLNEVAEKDKADAERKAEVLKKQEDTLKEAKEALKTAQDNNAKAEIIDSLEKIVKAIEASRDEAKADFDKSNEPLEAYKAEIDRLTDEYNTALEEIKTAKKAEATNGEAEVQPENPEGVVTEKGDAEIQPENPEGVVTEKGDVEVQPNKPEGVVTEKGDVEVQPENPEGVVTEKGDVEVQPNKPEGVATEKGDAEVQSIPAILTHTLTDGITVSVQFDNTKVNANELFAENITGDKAKEIEDLVKELNPNLTVVRALEIHFTGQDGKEVKTTGDRTVTFAVANDEGQELKVYHVNGTTLEEIPSSYKDGNITFNTSHFSNFVVTKLINTAAVNEVTKLDSATVKAEISKLKEQLKTADSTTAEKLQALIADNETLLEDLNVLEANLPAVNEVPEYTGPVATNGQEAPINNVPAFDLSKLNGTQGGTSTTNVEQKATEKPKAEVKNGKVLPNTGATSSNTVALGLSIITLAMFAIRRKLNK